MLGNIFNRNKDDDKEEDEKRQMVEGMQSMSDQILALNNQLNAKNAEIANLQKAAKDTSAKDANEAKALQAAQKQVADLQKQLQKLQRQVAASKAAPASTGGKSGEAAPSAGAGVASAGVGSSAPAAPAAPAATGGLSVGSTAYVTRQGGLPLRLRKGAGLNHEQIDRLAPGTQMTLLEGPRDADNYKWWRIRTTDGREGWVAGQELRSQPD